MSKFGNKLYNYSGVDIQLMNHDNGITINLSSNHGALLLEVPKPFIIDHNVDQKLLNIGLPAEYCDNKKLKAMWGTLCSLFNAKVKGLKDLFQKKVQLVGVGFKVALQGDVLVLKIGYSTDKKIHIPNGVKVTIVNPTNLTCTSINAELLGIFVDRLSKMRKYNVYTGSGLIVSGKYYMKKEKKGGK